MTVVNAVKIAVIATKTVGFDIVGLETPNTEFEENNLNRKTWVSSSVNLLECITANLDYLIKVEVKKGVI